MTITREIRTEKRLNDPNRFNLGLLSPGEKLFIWRHRQLAASGRTIGRNGAAMNQSEAAASLGLTTALYAKLEIGQKIKLSGDVEDLLDVAGELGQKLRPAVELKPTRGELCFLARRRSGTLLMTLERALGVSRPRYLELERAGNDAIVEYWSNRGYRFPS